MATSNIEAPDETHPDTSVGESPASKKNATVWSFACLFNDSARTLAKSSSFVFFAIKFWYYPLNKSSNADATSSNFFLSSTGASVEGVDGVVAGAGVGAGALCCGVESVC